MHKEDLWFSSRCGRGAWRVKNGWLSSGPAAFPRSQFAHSRGGLSQAGGSDLRFHPTAAATLRVTSLLLAPRSGLGPGSSLLGRQGAGRITRLELGWRPTLGVV